MRPCRLPVVAALVLALPLAHAGQPSPRIIAVRPSGSEVPANLLRFSIEFAAPVEGPVLPRIALTRADGTPLREPFLPQELWSPDARILTVLLHPGRVKSGLVAREELGPILRAGDEVELRFDHHPVKHWHVGPTDANGPVASAWRLSPVRAASRQPLVVTLDGPVDGRDTDDLAVVDAGDRLVDGHAVLEHGETTWRFDPAGPWQAGTYRLAVHGTLEDPAGNRLGSHFESAVGARLKPATDVLVVFDVASPAPTTAR